MAKKLHLATSTYKGYERNAHRHVLRALGRIGLRRLGYQPIESLYDALLHFVGGQGLSAKTAWPDIDFRKKRIALNRGLVAVGYELHQTRGKTRAARRSIDLDPTTMTVLAGWHAFQAAELAAVGITNEEAWVFTDGDGNAIHPHARSSDSLPTRIASAAEFTCRGVELIGDMLPEVLEALTGELPFTRRKAALLQHRDYIVQEASASQPRPRGCRARHVRVVAGHPIATARKRLAEHRQLSRSRRANNRYVVRLT